MTRIGTILWTVLSEWWRHLETANKPFGTLRLVWPCYTVDWVTKQNPACIKVTTLILKNSVQERAQKKSRATAGVTWKSLPQDKSTGARIGFCEDDVTAVRATDPPPRAKSPLEFTCGRPINATTVGTGGDWSPTFRLRDQQCIGPPTFWP